MLAHLDTPLQFWRERPKLTCSSFRTIGKAHGAFQIDTAQVLAGIPVFWHCFGGRGHVNVVFRGGPHQRRDVIHPGIALDTSQTYKLFFLKGRTRCWPCRARSGAT